MSFYGQERLLASYFSIVRLAGRLSSFGNKINITHAHARTSLSKSTRRAPSFSFVDSLENWRDHTMRTRRRQESERNFSKRDLRDGNRKIHEFGVRRARVQNVARDTDDNRRRRKAKRGRETENPSRQGSDRSRRLTVARRSRRIRPLPVNRSRATRPVQTTRQESSSRGRKGERARARTKTREQSSRLGIEIIKIDLGRGINASIGKED